MEIVRCKNGHGYDPSVTPECPECARLEGKTVPLATEAQNQQWANVEGGAADAIGKTMPVHALGNGIREGRAVEDTIPVNNVRGHWADESYYQRAENGAPTMPVDVVDDIASPVVGWLVCVDGVCRGQDFRIHADNNYIGRSPSMDICIAGDNTISRENHAIIAYDTREKVFYFAPGSGRGIVRLNNKAVLMMSELKAYDRIEIGRSILMFVPLCGEQFSWEELN